MTDKKSVFLKHKNSYDNFLTSIFLTDNIETGAADIFLRQADRLFTELKVSQNTFVSNYSPIF